MFEFIHNNANIRWLKKTIREFAYRKLYRIKTCRGYQKLRAIKGLYRLYMTVKVRIKKARRYEIGLTDEQLRVKVEAYIQARRNRPTATVVVYTAIVDNYDALKIPLDLNPDWDYVCFTDRAQFVGVHPWKIRPIPLIDGDPTRSARFVKLRPDICLPEYEESIWIDANILVRDAFLSEAFHKFSTSSYLIAGIPHPQRACTYDEFDACEKLNKDDPETLEEQRAYYRAIDFKSQQGLIETNLLFRKHNEEDVVEFQKKWWQLLNRFSRRDQLSVIPALQSASVDWMEIMPRGMFIANHPSFYIFFHGAKWTPDAIQYKVPGFLPREFCASTEPFWKELRSEEYDPILPNGPVDIVICVHNAPDDVERCLESVLAHIQPHDRVIIVDDGSEGEAVSVIQGYVHKSKQIEVIRQHSPIGYTRSANIGLKASTAELVILLNSDTIVTPNWSRKLLQVATKEKYIGIVGPLSNAASFQSIPRVRDPKTGGLAINALPRGKTIEDMNVLCEEYGNLTSFPLVPLVNGFCMGITRRVINTIGYFDEDSFPLGYGEEDDYTQRAVDAGFIHAIATHCYVHHAKSKSFGASRRTQLVELGAIQLRRKHGEHRINRAVATMANQPILGNIRTQIASQLKIKTADTFRTELARYSGLRGENVQSVLLSHEIIKKPELLRDSTDSERLNLIVMSKVSGRNFEVSEDECRRFRSQIELNGRMEPGTLDDVFTKFPAVIVIKEITGYSKEDLTEVISFCKSRDIRIYRVAENQAPIASSNRLFTYIDRHADGILWGGSDLLYDT
jgi:GT2 family glycosyltransferase